MSEYYGGIPSGELQEFLEAERQCQETAMNVLHATGARVRDLSFVPVNETSQIVVQRITSKPFLLAKNIDGEPGDYIAHIDCGYQMDMPVAPISELLPYEGAALFGLRLVVSSKRQLLHEYKRPEFFTAGRWRHLMCQFEPEFFALPFSPDMQDMAHSSQERTKQQQYSKWMDLTVKAAGLER